MPFANSHLFWDGGSSECVVCAQEFLFTWYYYMAHGCLWFIALFLCNYELSTCSYCWLSYWHSMGPRRRFFNLILDSDIYTLLLFLLYYNIVAAQSSATLIDWFLSSSFFFLCLLLSPKDLSFCENLEVKMFKTMNTWGYFIIMLLVYVKWGSLGLHVFFLANWFVDWNLIYNFLYLLLLDSHNFKLITHVGYIWHLSVMSIYLLK